MSLSFSFYFTKETSKIAWVSERLLELIKWVWSVPLTLRGLAEIIYQLLPVSHFKMCLKYIIILHHNQIRNHKKKFWLHRILLFNTENCVLSPKGLTHWEETCKEGNKPHNAPSPSAAPQKTGPFRYRMPFCPGISYMLQTGRTMRLVAPKASYKPNKSQLPISLGCSDSKSLGFWPSHLFFALYYFF